MRDGRDAYSGVLAIGDEWGLGAFRHRASLSLDWLESRHIVTAEDAMRHFNLDHLIAATINSDGDETCGRRRKRIEIVLDTPQGPSNAQLEFGFHPVIRDDGGVGVAMHLPSDDE